MKTLKQIKPGKTVRVVKINAHKDQPENKKIVRSAIKRRIQEMGITKGVEVLVQKVAPFGDPIEVTVRGYELSLRKDDAELIQVE